MKLQLGNVLKIFVTTNLDSSGSVLFSGFTPQNTRELAIVSGSLTAAQEKTFEYTDSTQLLDGGVTLEKFVNSNLALGTLSFTTYLNSSNNAPADVWLWNALTFESDYPNTDWTITPDYVTLPLERTATSPKKLGVFVVTEALVYVYDSVTLAGAAVQFNLDNLAQTAWSFNFLSSRILERTNVTPSLEGYQLSGTLTGTSARHVQSDYTLYSPRTLLASVYSSDGFKLGSLALRGLDLNIASQLNYTPDMSLDRVGLGYRFSGYGRFALEGSLSFYVRGTGSYANTLAEELLADVNVAGLNKTYTLLLELPLSATSKLCDIKIDNCALSIGTEYGSVLVNNLNFKGVYRTPEIVTTSTTNLYSYSEEFDNAVWTKSGATITTNIVEAPDGSITADKIVESATTGSHFLVRNLNLLANTTYTFSVYLKAAERTRIRLFNSQGAVWSTLGSAYFDLSSGTKVSGEGTITDEGNGWYRCSITGVLGASNASAGVGVYLVSTGTTTSYTGNGTSGAYLWGIQANTGTAVADYVSTTTAARTETVETNINVNDSFIKFYT